MNEQLEYFATCPRGFEDLLANELKRLRMHRIRPLKSGVAFFGSLADGYRACLWSRIASRVLRVLARVPADNADMLYESAKDISWGDFIAKDATISVAARGTNASLRNTQFTALKVKDAICDHLRGRRGVRPDVRPNRADVPVWVSVHGKKATISIDFAGESLHRRGYSTSREPSRSFVKETLAAAMLVWGGWDSMSSPRHRRALAQRQGMEGLEDAPAFVDPLCGSGTLVIEAAMMATDRAPGLSRDYWGFEGCADFDAGAFDDLLAEADERFEQGLEQVPKLIGMDTDPAVLEIARSKARRAGLGKIITFFCASSDSLENVLRDAGVDREGPGFIACVPPIGPRAGLSESVDLYRCLSAGIEDLGSSWLLCSLSQDPFFDSAIGFDSAQQLPIYNGSNDAMLRVSRLGNTFRESLSLMLLDGSEADVEVSSSHAKQFADRLRKMIKARRKWARRNDIHAYRVYDSDLPDYAVAIDVFEEDGTDQLDVLVTEYKAPKEIDPELAMRRFEDACVIARTFFGVDEEHLFTRVRMQERGGSQYRKDVRCSHSVIVKEAGLPFEVDLSGYLDTGLFLDHRITRALVGDMAKGKRFLNLFAYTGTASVYAAAGGAKQTTTVDMSQTYLEWARRNMQRAGYTGRQHCFIRADVLSWVDDARSSKDRSSDQYDLVFLDPPTFSNSKTMGERTWDIQRDHAALLGKIIDLVCEGGKIVFSGNLRSFKLDERAVLSMGLQIENITSKTIPEDFSRNPRIHFCYVLTKRSSSEE